MSRHGADLVYIFHGDIERMKRNPGKKWDLYGLRTHSSCPVVQYVCEEGSRSADGLGLELLGQCVPRGSASRNNRSSSSGEPWLEVRNDGVQLEAALQQQQRSSGFRPPPVRCPVKVQINQFSSTYNIDAILNFEHNARHCDISRVKSLLHD